MRGNPQALISSLERTNPDFARFMAANRGKTPQQCFAEHGLDLGQILSQL